MDELTGSRNMVWLVLKFAGAELEFLHIDSVWSTVEGAVDRLNALGCIPEGNGKWKPVDTAWVQGPNRDEATGIYFIDVYEVDRAHY